MHPVDALHEIAFWLERDLAATFRVQAFRRAAAAIDGLDDDELAARAHDGRLARTKGVGARSLEVVQQALDQRVPDYLQDLRDREREVLSPAGADLLAALRGDLHCHSDWSDGGTPIAEMVRAARTLGREYVAITDHSPNLTIAHGLTAERLGEQLDLLDEVRAAHPDVRVFSGIEIDILEDGTLDQTTELLDGLDVVVASVHSKLRADRATMTERMLGGIRDPHTTILGHVTGRLVDGPRSPRPESEFDARAVFEACVEHGVAVEINARPERQDPPDDLLALALEVGCVFSIDTDAHAPGQLGFLGLGAERAAAAGVPADRIITTWDADRLLAWARR